MSTLQYQRVIDQRLDLQNTRQKTYGILNSASDQTWQQFPSQAASVSNIQFTVNPPSDKTYVNRKAYFSLSGTLTFTGTPTSGSTTLLNCSGLRLDPAAAPGSTLGSGDYDAPRCMPISRALSSFQTTIGNNTLTQSLNLYSQIYQRYQRDLDEENRDLSMTPSMPDQSQLYQDLEGDNLSPLRKYGVNTVQDSRGGFSQVTVLSNVPGATTASISFVYTEPFMISPWEFGRGQEKLAFIGVQNMTVSAVFGGPGLSPTGNIGGALWSHSPSNFGGSSAITSIVPSNFNGSVFFNYLTSDEFQQIPRPDENTYYSYISPVPYPTTGLALVAGGGVGSTQMSSVQLQSVPNRMYIWLEQRPQDKDVTSTDTYFRIDSVSILFDNKNGLLAGASSYDLYQMSVRNGLNYSWNQWNSKIGSVLCVVFGLDLPLKDLVSPGMMGSKTLTMNVNYTNISTASMIPQLNVLVMQEGIMNIQGGNVQTQLGIINEQDVVNSKQQDPISYKNSGNISGSGFWDDVLSFFKKAAPVAHAVTSVVAPEFAPITGAVSRVLGNGYSGGARASFRSRVR